MFSYQGLYDTFDVADFTFGEKINKVNVYEYLFST